MQHEHTRVYGTFPSQLGTEKSVLIMAERFLTPYHFPIFSWSGDHSRISKVSPIDLIDWEVLRSPIKLTVLESTNKLPDGLDTIIIERTDSYGISALLQGFVDIKEANAWRQHQDAFLAGETGHSFGISGICETGFTATLHNVLLTGQHTLRGDGQLSVTLHVPLIVLFHDGLKCH